MKNLVSFFSLIYYACKVLLIISLFNWWINKADASTELVSANEMAGVEVDQKLMNILGNGMFSFKKTIACGAPIKARDSFIQTRAATSYRLCGDKTVTFDQPSSSGAGGWNGYCGQVAVSNTAGMLCGRFIAPELIDEYATDITPGNRPGTNRKALNKIFSETHPQRARRNPCPAGAWTQESPWTENGLMEGLQKALWDGPGRVERKRPDGSIIHITPVAVLISAGAQAMHWVTLVDFHQNNDDKFGCDAVVNTWGGQRLMTCEKLVEHGLNPIFGYRFLKFE